ncbi:MAG: carbohydrate-binding protein, partial [Candidatus Omnitrophica bacterium]|nr:carbohydrate-binding protein [Candidatus Omnitrophota bacterium]
MTRISVGLCSAYVFLLATWNVGAAPLPSYDLPGRLQAEDYKPGGAGVGYVDTTAGNAGGAYRSDDVDIEPTQDLGGGFNVGWIEAGEWLAFDVQVTQHGHYDLTARVASDVPGTKTLHVEVDGVDV